MPHDIRHGTIIGSTHLARVNGLGKNNGSHGKTGTTAGTSINTRAHRIKDGTTGESDQRA